MEISRKTPKADGSKLKAREREKQLKETVSGFCLFSLKIGITLKFDAGVQFNKLSAFVFSLDAVSVIRA